MSEIKTIKMDKGSGDKYSVVNFQVSSVWEPNSGDVGFRFSNYQHPVEHIHQDFCEIYCVFSGEVCNVVNGESVLMQQGDCC